MTPYYNANILSHDVSHCNFNCISWNGIPINLEFCISQLSPFFIDIWNSNAQYKYGSVTHLNVITWISYTHHAICTDDGTFCIKI